MFGPVVLGNLCASTDTCNSRGTTSAKKKNTLKLDSSTDTAFNIKNLEQIYICSTI